MAVQLINDGPHKVLLVLPSSRRLCDDKDKDLWTCFEGSAVTASLILNI